MSFKIYGVYENGNEIFRGTNHEICDKFYVNNVYSYASNKIKIQGIYEVRYIETVNHVSSIKKGKPVKKIPKFEREINYILEHLERYGNVFMPINPVEHIKYLKRKGIKVDVKEYYHKANKETDYILTEINSTK